MNHFHFKSVINAMWSDGKTALGKPLYDKISLASGNGTTCNTRNESHLNLLTNTCDAFLFSEIRCIVLLCNGYQRDFYNSRIRHPDS